MYDDGSPYRYAGYSYLRECIFAYFCVDMRICTITHTFSRPLSPLTKTAPKAYMDGVACLRECVVMHVFTCCVRLSVYVACVGVVYA